MIFKYVIFDLNFDSELDKKQEVFVLLDDENKVFHRIQLWKRKLILKKNLVLAWK